MAPTLRSDPSWQAAVPAFLSQSGAWGGGIWAAPEVGLGDYCPSLEGEEAPLCPTAGGLQNPDWKITVTQHRTALRAQSSVWERAAFGAVPPISTAGRCCGWGVLYMAEVPCKPPSHGEHPTTSKAHPKWSQGTKTGKAPPKAMRLGAFVALFPTKKLPGFSSAPIFHA